MKEFLNDLKEDIYFLSTLIIPMLFCLLVMLLTICAILGIPTYCIIKIIEAIKS